MRRAANSLLIRLTISLPCDRADPLRAAHRRERVRRGRAEPNTAAEKSSAKVGVGSVVTARRWLWHISAIVFLCVLRALRGEHCFGTDRHVFTWMTVP